MVGTELMTEEQLRGTRGWPSPIWVTGQITGGGLEVIVIITGVGAVLTVEVMMTGDSVTMEMLVMIGAVVWVV